MNYMSEIGGRGHVADKPRRRASTDLCCSENEPLIVNGKFECLNLLPLDSERLVSRIVSEIGFAVIVSLENKVKRKSSIFQKLTAGSFLLWNLSMKSKLTVPSMTFAMKSRK